MALEQIEKTMLAWIKELNSDTALELYAKVAQGKRLRAKLILKIAPNNTQTIFLASIIELIHLASLLHDDVIDDAKTRRGKISINASDGDKMSIMLGDIFYSKGFFELCKFDTKIAQSVSNAVTLLSLGELQDVKLGKAFNSNAQLYIDMIENKTASLIQSATESAAMLVDKDSEAYFKYGKNLGLAFQIIDDILDITQDEKTLGKPALSDFKDGKTTLPYIYLYDLLNTKEKEKLKSYHLKTLNKEEKHWIKDKMNTHKVIEKSYNLAQKLSNEAIALVPDEPELIAIVNNLMERQF
jgi:octaprenyl-diphosphate synthase